MFILKSMVMNNNMRDSSSNSSTLSKISTSSSMNRWWGKRSSSRGPISEVSNHRSSIRDDNWVWNNKSMMETRATLKVSLEMMSMLAQPPNLERKSTPTLLTTDKSLQKIWIKFKTIRDFKLWKMNIMRWASYQRMLRHQETSIICRVIKKIRTERS